MLGENIKLHLHARKITFPHPQTMKKITVEAPLPEHMQKTWKTLGLDLDYQEPIKEDKDEEKEEKEEGGAKKAKLHRRSSKS
jgi:hypothetical protein